jgi:nucleotide-binding universal stress UspA family protein
MSGLVLVPLDGSALADRALPYAVAAACDRHHRLLLLRVLQPKSARGMPLIQEPTARAELERVAERLRKDRIEVEIVVSSTLFGTVADVIVGIAREHACDLIVMSTHGRGGLGRWLYGSVAEQVLRQSPVPVLLISATCDRIWTPESTLRVLVPLDGSPLAEHVLEPMLASTRGLASELVLVRVAPAPTAEAGAYLLEDREAEMEGAEQYLEEVAERLRTDDLRVTVRTEVGAPAAVIANIAAKLDVDLIAMATHGRSGFARVVLGSVATETLQRSSVPLLLLRPPSLTRDIAPASAASRELGHAPVEVESDAPQGGRQPTLLVALDLTEKADAALGPAARLARACDAKVVLLNVFWPPVDMGHLQVGSQAERIEYVRTERRMYLKQKARAFEDLDISTRVEVQAHSEEVDECIARVAREVDADVLVVVSKCVSGPASVVLGSFAQGILRLSPCPVLVVRPAAGERERVAGTSAEPSGGAA